MKRVDMTSIQARIAKKILQAKPYSWSKGTINEQRARQEKSTRFFKIPKEIHCQPVKINDMTAEWITCSAARNGVILYLHGGAYALGSINVHREYLARLAITTQLKVLAINYRLAPEHPFPAALEDSLMAYRWLLSQGHASSCIVIAGDSAGGGLTLSTLVSLRDAGDSLPACAVCLSPWVDLTFSSKSIHTKARVDPILNANVLEIYSRYYAGDFERNLPLISPVFADLKGLPPLLIHAGTNEILLDEGIQISENARSVGVDVTLETWKDMFHAFQVIPFLPETQRSLDKIERFISGNILDGCRGVSGHDHARANKKFSLNRTNR
jgi:epsilon-lactone hydrolase